MVGHVDPAHDTGHEISVRGDLEEFTCFLHVADSLDEDRPIDPVGHKERAQLLWPKGLPKGVRHPGIVAEARIPEMVMAVDTFRD
jgi:hypothetical protein